MKFQVPQFIETEDKIVGPFTLKQFLFIAAAGILILILFFMLQLVFWVVASLIIGTLAIALAFLKINGQPLPQVVLAAFFFMSRPRLFLWRRKIEEKVLEIPNVESFAPITVGVKKRARLPFLKDQLEAGSRAIPARETPQISRITLHQPDIGQQAKEFKNAPFSAPKTSAMPTPSPRPTPIVITPVPMPPVSDGGSATSISASSPWQYANASPAPEPTKESIEEVVITLDDGNERKVKRVDY